MDIHKAKPWHGGREFVKEIGTIVVGVLIALGGEQAVQRLEWSHRVHLLEVAMRRELLSDDGPQLYMRSAMHGCALGKLDEIRAGVEGDAGRSETVSRITGYHLSFFSFDTLAHQAATQAGVADHMAPDRLQLWTLAYSMMPYIERTNEIEAEEIGRLRALKRTGGPLTSQEQAQVLNAVEQLRTQENRMFDASHWTLIPLLRIGPLDERQKQELLKRARAWYGACVQDPPDFTHWSADS